MDKEKRKLTLKQLETGEKIASKVFGVATILILVVLGIFVMTIPRDLPYAQEIIFPIFIGISSFLIIVMMISCKISEIIRKRISIAKEEMKIKILKQLAKKHGGHIKQFVTIKDKDTIKHILSRGIVKIVVDSMEGPNLVTSIQLTDDTWQTGVYIPSEKLISILDEDSKKEMLDHLIKYIKIGNLDGKTTEVTISSPGFLNTNAQTTDKELLEMFELKE